MNREQTPFANVKSAHVAGLLLFFLVGYPLIRMWPVVGGMSTNVGAYWLFWGKVILGHWAMVLMIAFLLAHNKISWRAIGLDLDWVKSRIGILAIILVSFVALAVIGPEPFGLDVPEYLKWYADFLPSNRNERIMFVLVSLTAGVCEEVVYRGFSITAMGRWIRNPWVAAVFSSLGFAYMHGMATLVAPIAAVYYFVIGFAFSAVFIICRFKRLEFFVIIHFVLDASLIVYPWS